MTREAKDAAVLNLVREVPREYAVKHFMSRNPVTIGKGVELRDAVERMVTQGVATLIVLEEKSRPIGLITERHIIDNLSDGKGLDSKVDDFMSMTIPDTSPSSTSKEAAMAMTDAKGCLVVIDEGRVVGIVTPSDLLKVIWRIRTPVSVGDVASRKVVETPTSASIIDAVKLMHEHGVGSIIITLSESPRGIFTGRDLLSRVLYPRRPLGQAVVTVATFPIVTTEVGVTGNEAARIMMARRVKRLPLTRDGKIVAVLTARDLVEAYAFESGVRDKELEAQLAVHYGEVCVLCNTRIDDKGLCGCGTEGGD